MERLMDRIYDSQCNLEDAFLLECSCNEAMEIGDGRKLIRYLRRRRRRIRCILNLLEKV